MAENQLTSVIGVTENGNISVLNCDRSHRSGGSVVYESFTWLFIALLSVDAVRELIGLSSIMGMCETWPAGHVTRDYFSR